MALTPMQAVHLRVELSGLCESIPTQDSLWTYVWASLGYPSNIRILAGLTCAHHACTTLATPLAFHLLNTFHFILNLHSQHFLILQNWHQQCSIQKICCIRIERWKELSAKVYFFIILFAEHANSSVPCKVIAAEETSQHLVIGIQKGDLYFWEWSFLIRHCNYCVYEHLKILQCSMFYIYSALDSGEFQTSDKQQNAWLKIKLLKSKQFLAFLPLQFPRNSYSSLLESMIWFYDFFKS